MAATHEEKNRKEQNRFSHLGIDTSALIGAGWPHPSLDLDNVVTTCKALEVPVLIPELVLAEAQIVSLERTAEIIQKAQDALRRAGDRLAGLVDPGAITWPNRPARRTAYDSVVKGVSDRWSWTELPLPDVSLGEAVYRSARHEYPFAITDISFRDSLILWSLLDALKPGDILGLIAIDGFFSERRADKPEP
jgi:hypothetical protein